MNVRHQFMVAADHPSLPGHFPGRPVVPGVVILDEICSKVLGLYPGYRLDAITHVKFTSLLRPGEKAELALEGTPEALRFRCCVGGNTVAAGGLRLAVTAAV